MMHIENHSISRRNIQEINESALNQAWQKSTQSIISIWTNVGKMDKRKARKIRKICLWQCGSQRLLVIIQCEDSKFLTHFLSVLGPSQGIEVDRLNCGQSMSRSVSTQFQIWWGIIFLFLRSPLVKITMKFEVAQYQFYPTDKELNVTPLPTIVMSSQKFIRSNSSTGMVEM